MPGGGGVPRGRGAGERQGRGCEAHPEKETGGGTPGRGGRKGHPWEGKKKCAPGRVRVGRASPGRGGGIPQLPDARRGAPGAAGRSPAHLRGVGSGRGTPPSSASSFSPPLRRLPPSLPPCPPAWDGGGSREHPAGRPWARGAARPGPGPGAGGRPAGGTAVSGLRSPLRRRRRHCHRR